MRRSAAHAASRPLPAGLLALCLAAFPGCRDEAPPAAVPAPPVPVRAPFEEVAARAGLDFVHFNGMSGELYFVENMGGGAALLDFDGDGDLDVFLTQGAMLGPGKTFDQAQVLVAPALPLGDRLYRNEGPGEDGIPRFLDVTAASGLGVESYAMGAATGDFDNDGAVDLYVTAFGSNRLWRGRGDGTFEDATARAGVDDPRWSTAATFFDYDRDGLLDLFVGNYVDFRFELHRPCLSESGVADYCSPENYEPVPDRLWRGRGDGTFEDVTEASGLAAETGKALGAIAADLDGDGWQDLYVANDQMPNFLWINQGDGTFRNEALLGGAAVNREGRAEASMGIDAGDLDGDGDEDLFLSHLQWESNTLYVNASRPGHAAFRDRSFESGLGAPSLGLTGFGTRFLDYDNDSSLDLLVVNGAVKHLDDQLSRGELLPLRQRDQLFRGRGDGTFEDVSAAAGEALAVETVSRGAAFGDLDGDGDTDVVVAQNHGPVRLLLNRLDPARRSWLGLRLTSRDGRRDMLGARIAVGLSDGRVLWRRCHTDGSYLSAGDPRVLVGLGDAEPSWVRVHWPDGTVEQWPAPDLGAYHALRQGQGRSWSNTSP